MAINSYFRWLIYDCIGILYLSMILFFAVDSVRNDSVSLGRMLFFPADNCPKFPIHEALEHGSMVHGIYWIKFECHSNSICSHRMARVYASNMWITQYCSNRRMPKIQILRSIERDFSLIEKWCKIGWLQFFSKINRISDLFRKNQNFILLLSFRVNPGLLNESQTTTLPFVNGNMTRKWKTTLELSGLRNFRDFFWESG